MAAAVEEWLGEVVETVESAVEERLGVVSTRRAGLELLAPRGEAARGVAGFTPIEWFE